MAGNGEEHNDSSGGLISEMVIGGGQKEPSGAELIVEPESSSESDSFSQELEKTLLETESLVSGISAAMPNDSWPRARGVVEEFQPVPWFIWRLSNFVLSKSGHINPISEGLVFGLRRLLFAAASDSIIGQGEKVNNVRKALEILPSDVVAAVAVIHAVSRRLASRQFERIWRPILDDAILRAHIGYFVGGEHEDFGPGRGMLAGFAGRSGLAVLLATGELAQARHSLEQLATGAEIKQVGMSIYNCEPLQISAMMLSATGCGRDAAFGTVGHASENSTIIVENDHQLRWLSAFAITEHLRTGTKELIPDHFWAALNYSSVDAQEELAGYVKKLIRRGHGWNWLG